jgi:transcription termination/antitermination protein NusA
MDTSAFFSAIGEIAEAKGISKEAVIEALREALQRAYIKYLGGGDDAVVKATVDEKTGEISLSQIKKVVKDVQDDYLEISVEDANKGLKEAKYKAGDDFSIFCPLDELTKLTAMAVKSNLRQKIAEAERAALYDIYKDHIGEMVTGTVEKADDRSVSVNIGRTSVELGRHELIGDEYFKVGDPIKVYIQEVRQADDVVGKPTHGPQIEATRSSEGFLKRLFEEEIHEIYDGTVIIKGIAREAGIRSKVAVSSNNEDVDATGACIGPGGSRIQKIVSQLGNGKDKEKIDIIAWSADSGLFIAESLRPAQVLGVALIDPIAYPHPKAIAVVKDEQLSLAIGKKGANARLANKLTGWSIDIKEESEATSSGLVYVTTEELSKKADEAKKVAEREAYAEKSKAEAAKRSEEKKVAPASTLGEVPSPAAGEVSASEAATTVSPAPSPVAAPAPSISALPEKPLVVHTTTTLESLEKELESAKEKKTVPTTKYKRPRKITEDEVEHVKPTDAAVSGSASTLPIYSQEELDQIAQEENDNPEVAAPAEPVEENVDLEDYDKYYDDEKK